MNPVYCQKCRSQLNANTPFCPLCGHQQNQAPSPPQPQAPPPPQYNPPPTHQTIIVKQGSGAGVFWIIFTLLAIFTPLGCFVFPVLILGGGIAAIGGLAMLPIILTLAPMIIATLIAVRIAKDAKAQGRSLPIPVILSILFVGALASGGIMYGFGGSPTSPPAPVVKATPLPENQPYVGFFGLDEFGKEYDSNKINIKTNYGDKRIALRGKVESIIGTNTQGVIILRGLKSNAAITCNFNERTTAQVTSLREGQQADIIGLFDGGEEQSMATDRLTMYDCSLPMTNKAQPGGR